MGTVWKTVLTLAIIFLITATGMMVTSANADIIAARNYMEEIMIVIKESNYNEGIINQCQEEAKENGYDLQVVVYGNMDYMNSSYAQVSLYYQYRLPMFQIAEQKKLECVM